MLRHCQVLWHGCIMMYTIVPEEVGVRYVQRRGVNAPVVRPRLPLLLLLVLLAA